MSKVFLFFFFLLKKFPSLISICVWFLTIVIMVVSHLKNYLGFIFTEKKINIKSIATTHIFMHFAVNISWGQIHQNGNFNSEIRRSKHFVSYYVLTNQFSNVLFQLFTVS